MKPISFRADNQGQIKLPFYSGVEKTAESPSSTFTPNTNPDFFNQIPLTDTYMPMQQRPTSSKADSIYKWGSLGIMVVLAGLMALSLKPIIGNPFSRKYSLNSLFENYKNNENIITLSKLPGMQEVKHTFQQKVVNPMKYRELFEKEKVEPGMFCILYGPPGTGKTNFVKSAAKEVDAYVATFALSQEGSAFIHTTSTNIEKKSQAIIKHAKHNPDREFFVLFDEVEAILTETTKSYTDESSKDSDEIIRTFLMIMDKFKEYKNIRVFATTNQNLNPTTSIIGNMNSAAMSRFGTKIHVGNPDAEALASAVRLHFEKYPSAQELIKDNDLLEKIGKRLEGYSYRDFEHIRDCALEIMMSKKIKIKEAKGNPDNIKLTESILEEAIQKFAKTKQNPNIHHSQSQKNPIVAKKTTFLQRVVERFKKQPPEQEPPAQQPQQNNVA